MKHFFERIRAKGLEAREAPVLIVAFGDSVTQGAMERDTLDPEGVYHRLLQRKLETFYPAATFSTINSGVGGDWADRAQERVERDVIRYQPDLVLLAFGLNDACSGISGLPAFEAAIRKIISEVRAKTPADVLILTPPFMASKETSRIPPEFAHFVEPILKTQTEGLLAKYSESLRTIAKELGVPVADVQAEWERLVADGVPVNDWFTNGLNHPNRRGHQIAADLVWHTLLSSRP